MQLAEYLDRYATTRPVDPGTVRQYSIAVRLLERHAGGPLELEQLQELAVSEWLRELGRTRRPATVRGKRAAVLALWRAAADDGLVDPPRRRVRLAPVPWEPPACWTIEHARQLVRTARRLPRLHPCGLRRREWWPLAIRLAWDTGLRWGDLVRLRFADVDREVVSIVQSKVRRPHVAKLWPSTMAALEESRARCPRDLVVPWGSSRESFTDQARRLVVKAGVPAGTWKWLRRGGATDVELQEPGRGFASRHLGHRMGTSVAHLHYIDMRIVAATVPIVQPREIGEVD
jgi:integrase